MTLLAFAAVCHATAAPAAAAVDQYRLPAGPTAATRRTLLQRLVDGTDRRCWLYATECD